MAPPHPSSEFLSARRIVRDDAVGRTERRLGVPPEVMPAVAGLATEQMLSALRGIDARHAGWAALATGTMLVRNCERIPVLAATGAGAGEPDRATAGASPSFTAALAWAALLAAVVGDRVLVAEAPAAPGRWEPGEIALESRRIGRELAASADASPFVADALDELTAGLPSLDPWPAGWALLVLGVWIGANAERISAPLTRRRLLARRLVTDPDEARAGCHLAAALMARIGEVLIARSA
jgi:hypothetical protein